MALINIEVRSQPEFDPLFQFSKESRARRHLMLKTLRIKGEIQDQTIKIFLGLMCRNYYPALEYCSLHTVLPCGRVDVQTSIKEALIDKSNKNECLKWFNSS
jgi:hypothetical protein